MYNVYEAANKSFFLCEWYLEFSYFYASYPLLVSIYTASCLFFTSSHIPSSACFLMISERLRRLMQRMIICKSFSNIVFWTRWARPSKEGFTLVFDQSFLFKLDFKPFLNSGLVNQIFQSIILSLRLAHQ